MKHLRELSISSKMTIILNRLLLALGIFSTIAHSFTSCQEMANVRRVFNTKSASRFLKSARNIDDDTLLDDKFAYPQQTPHSGRHFLPSHPAYRRPLLRRAYWKRRRRFMEGWYYRLTLKENNLSFAFIISIEDPGLSTDLKLACIQCIGPEDSYLVRQKIIWELKLCIGKKTQSLF